MTLAPPAGRRQGRLPPAAFRPPAASHLVVSGRVGCWPWPCYT